MPGKRITPKQRNLIEQVRAGKVQQYIAETGAVRWLIAQADAAPGEGRTLDTLEQRGIIAVRPTAGSHAPVTVTGEA